jgi:hypothetical protein
VVSLSKNHPSVFVCVAVYCCLPHRNPQSLLLLKSAMVQVDNGDSVGTLDYLPMLVVMVEMMAAVYTEKWSDLLNALAPMCKCM